MRSPWIRWLMASFLVTVPLWGAAVEAQSGPARGRKVVSEPEARAELHITAYRGGRQDTAFLREVRDVDIPAGDVRIALRGVPDTVERPTVTIRVVDGPGLEVLEQSFAYDVMTPDSLMRAAEGTNVTIEVAGVNDGKLRAVGAQVVATGREGAVVRTKDGYTYGLEGERHRFSRVPERLSPQPTLEWHARSATAGKRRIEIAYLMTGLRWTADYVGNLSRDGKRIDLSGWVTFQNDTAGRFEDANLAVAAGTIHRAPVVLDSVTLGMMRFPEGRSLKRHEAVQEALGHLHLYKIPGRTHLEPRSIKNVRLLSLRGVAVERRWTAGFHVRPEREQQTMQGIPRLRLDVSNDEKSNAGIPIPAGLVRVMIPDRKGTPHMVASTHVVDTPAGEKLVIDMGSVTDIRARLVPKEYKTGLLGAKEGTYSLELRNGSTLPGVLRVDLQTDGFTTIEVRGAKVERPSATTWRLDIPLAGGAVRTFSIVARTERPRSSR